MRQIFSKVYPGLICICEKCGCLFGYQNEDIYGNLVYCPLCKNGNTIEYDRNYDGIIKQEIKEKND
jgi:hypothetical protein